MRGTISREHPWEVMPDLYFYRDPEEVGELWKALCQYEVCCLCSCLWSCAIEDRLCQYNGLDTSGGS